MLRILQASLELWGVLFCIFIILCLYIQKTTDIKERTRFINLFYCSMFVLGGDSIALLFRGSSGQTAYYVILITNFISFLFTYLLCISFQIYVLYSIKVSKWLYRSALAVRILGFFYLILLVISQFTGWFYYIDDNNRYTRGSLFWFSQSYGLVAFGMILLIILISRNQFSNRKLFSLLGYIIFLVIALTLQITIYGYGLINLVSLFSLMWMFLTRQFEINQAMITRERRIVEKQTQVILSQIQPHFLYNELNTLYYLSDKEPEKTKKAISNFADYLRGNLRYINQFTVISFQAELDHTLNYLELEKLRFGDKLNWICDIETTSFKVPPLSLQPIAENAVKHGIRKRRKGGTVWITVKDEKKQYRIILEDNGIGFDETKVPLDGDEGHIGIISVRERINEMCNGTFEIASKPGKGTIVTYLIPKGANIDENHRS